MKLRLIPIALSVLCLAFTSTSSAKDNELSLKNLERERAAFIKDMLDTSLDAEQRQAKLSMKTRQLIDIERMVLRDDRLLRSNSRLVQKAFQNYDLTFLVHAGAEQKLDATQQWLKQVNLSNASILNAKAGYR